MSDQQQGPGWWRASDGKWYPPNAGQVAPTYRPMPTRSQSGMSNGALMAIIGGVGVLLIGLAVLVALANDSNEGEVQSAKDVTDEAATAPVAALPDDGLTDEEREERADVEITGCGSAEFQDMVATLEVTNHSSEPSLYFIDVVFESPDGSRQFGTSIATVDELGPGQVTTVEASNFNPGSESAGRFECRIADAQRFAS